MSIPEIREWLETNQRNLALGAACFLVGSICFALGYLYRGEAQRAQIVIATAQPTNLDIAAPKKKTPAIKVVPPKPVIPPPVTIVYTQPPTTTPPVAPTLQTPASAALAFTEVSADKSPGTAPTIPMAVIVITEVTAGTEASGDDEFIELYNSNSVAVDLTGYSIKKRTSGGSESTLVSATRLQNKSIPAGKHFLIAHDQGYLGSVPADATWAKSNGLAYTSNAVILYNAAGSKLSEVLWTELTKGQSTSGAPSPQNSLF